MKIAVLSPINWETPPEKYGPLELIASYITEGMVKRGHKVTLYATGDSKTKAKLRSVCPKALEKEKLSDSRVYQYLHNSLVFEEADQFDIIHNHNDVYPLVFSRLIKTPLLTTIHGYYPGIEKIYNKYKESNFVSISLAARKQLPNLNYVANIYHGIPIEKFSFNKKPENYYCYLGRITPKKGVHLAIRIAKKMGIGLLLAGIIPNDELTFFEKEVKPNLGNKIKYLGNLGDEKMDIYKDAKALIHLNTEPEAFGLTLVEAMACGTPVIGMDCGAVNEVVENMKTGFVVKNQNEAEEAIKKIETIERKACRQRVENYFTIEKMLDGYEAVYQMILNNNSSSCSEN